MSEWSLLTSSGTKCKVSSSVGKQYSKDHMFDGNSDTCWQSKEGKPQSIAITFEGMKVVRKVLIQFQGGFAATECQVMIDGSEESGTKWQALQTLHPHDNNHPQEFQIAEECLASTTGGGATQNVRIVFPDSTDQFGRVVVYKLNIYGTDAP